MFCCSMTENHVSPTINLFSNKEFLSNDSVILKLSSKSEELEVNEGQKNKLSVCSVKKMFLFL